MFRSNSNAWFGAASPKNHPALPVSRRPGDGARKPCRGAIPGEPPDCLAVAEPFALVSHRLDGVNRCPIDRRRQRWVVLPFATTTGPDVDHVRIGTPCGDDLRLGAGALSRWFVNRVCRPRRRRPIRLRADHCHARRAQGGGHRRWGDAVLVAGRPSLDSLPTGS